MDFDAKLRPLYILKILREQTDENHKLSTVQLCKLLKDEYGIDTFRTTIKTDIEVLQQAGYKIEVTRSSQNQYHYAECDFSAREIKSMIDAIMSTKQINQEMQRTISEKLTRLAGPFKTQDFKRNWIHIGDDLITTAPIDCIMDTINEAINKRRKIRFHSFEYNVKKQPVMVSGNVPIVLSPYALCQMGEYVYVIGSVDKSQDYSMFRVDRFFDIPEIMEEMAVFTSDWDSGLVEHTAFNTENAPRTEVELQVDNSLMSEIIDKFGRGVSTYACDQKSFRVIANVGVGPSFYSWLFGLQGRVKIKSPISVLSEFNTMIKKIAE